MLTKGSEIKKLADIEKNVSHFICRACWFKTNVIYHVKVRDTYFKKLLIKKQDKVISLRNCNH
jgi:hypothetical protein